MSFKQKVKEIFKPSPRKFGLKILRNATFNVVDVGAANGLIPHWHTLDGLANVISFEPHDLSYNELLRKYAKSDYAHMYTAFPFGLSKNGGKTILYMLNERTGSSILPIDLESPFLIKNDPYVFPIVETEIETKSLEQVIKDNNFEYPAMMKLDIQGAEVEVFEGLGKEGINELLSIELEVGFQSFHKNAPTPFSTIELMRNYNFDFFDMTTNRLYTGKGNDSKYYLNKLNVSSIYNKVSNRLVETDLLFFKNQDYILDKNDVNAVNKLIIAYCVYNYFAEACQLNERALELKIITSEAYNENFKNIRNWSNIYNRSYPLILNGFYGKWKNIKSHIKHKPWQTAAKEL